MSTLFQNLCAIVVVLQFTNGHTEVGRRAHGRTAVNPATCMTARICTTRQPRVDGPRQFEFSNE